MEIRIKGKLNSGEVVNFWTLINIDNTDYNKLISYVMELEQKIY